MAEPSPAPFLKFEEGDGREIPLISGSVWKIGRGEQNAIVLIHDLVSRNHAMIQRLEDGEFYLIDMPVLAVVSVCSGSVPCGSLVSPSGSYSSRSAVTGSTRIARRAGK